MTLESIKAEIREAYDQKFPCRHHAAECDGHCNADKLVFLDTALDRIAEETKKAIVPEEKKGATTIGDIYLENVHNSARSQMEANYQSWTKKV